MDKNNKPNSTDTDDEGGTAKGQAFRDFLRADSLPDHAVNKTLNEIRKALLGVAEVETDILKRIKDHLDKMLNQIYAQVRDYQNVVILDAMVSDDPMLAVDASFAQGLEDISKNLNEKNFTILKLRRELESLGIGVFADSNMSSEMLRQQVDALNKRNKQLLNIHQELAKHPMITGRVSKDVSIKDIRAMLERLTKQISQLNETNAELKAQIKQQKLQTLSKKRDNKPDEPDTTSGFRRR